MRVYVPTERPSPPVSNLISKKLEINGFKPILGDISPFLSGLPKGAGVYIPRPLFGDANQLNVLTGLPKLDKLISPSTTSATQRQPATLNPQTVPQNPPPPPGTGALSWVPTVPASGLPTKPIPIEGFTPPSWSAKKGWKSAGFGRSVATKGVGVMLLTQGTTQAQIADPLIHVGVPAQTANGMANAALTFMHSHGFSALAVAFSVAGGVAAIDGFVRPGQTRRWGLYAAVGILAFVLFFFLAPKPNPLIGAWSLDATQSRYEVGDAPQEASYKIEEKKDGLIISDDYVLPNSKPTHDSYELILDGKDHPAMKGILTDTVSATLAKNTLEVAFKKSGQIIAHKTLVVSADQKVLTVTDTGVKPSNQEFKNIAVYEKKK